ncbi:MAG: serine hydrolase, partial [Pseudomonadales bacterium]|nr:serine hydrolase [Pseudomonadales bacterium]
MDFVRISPPSAQNVDAEGISNFLQALNNDPQLEAHGLIIHRNGYRIAEGYWAPHQAQDLRLVYSLSKSFSGTALSLMIGEGRLGLDDLVQDYLPEYFETADPAFQNLRIRHLASMASGHDKETNGLARQLEPDDPVKGFLRIPPAAEPGTLFAYNQPPVLALVTILQRLAGQRLLDYLQPRLFEPLGIKDARWAQHQPDIDLGYSGLYINLDAAARLGQLYLEDGVWQGNRLLPEGWVSQASAVQTPNPMNTEPDWQQGYGFQLWRSRHGYRGDGAMGQYMVVLPEQNALIAMFSCLNNMQRVLDLMWEHLLPAMPTTPASLPVSAHDADERLAMQLQQLARPTAAQRLNGTAPIPADQSFTPETAPERLAGKST